MMRKPGVAVMKKQVGRDVKTLGIRLEEM